MHNKNISNLNNLDLNKTLIDDGFISIINNLSYSIKKFYQVSKSVIENEMIIINTIKKEEVELFQKKNEKINELLKKLETTIKTDEQNLCFFFKDAKVLFKKMKEQQEIIINDRKRNKSNFTDNRERTTNNDTNNSYNNYYSNFQRRGLNNVNVQSEINENNNHLNNTQIISLKSKKVPFESSFKINNCNNKIIKEINSKIINKTIEYKNNSKERNNTFCGNSNYNTNVQNNSANRTQRKNYCINSKKDFEKYMALKKKYEIHLKELNNALKKYGQNFGNNNEINNYNCTKYNELKATKNNISNNNIFFYQNNKSGIQNTNKENTKTRSLSPLILAEKDKCQNSNLIYKINILSKKNNILTKENVGLKKILRQNDASPYSDYSRKIQKKFFESKNFEKEIENLNAKIKLMEKKLIEEKTRNKELLNKNKKLENINKEILTKNSELTKNVLNKKNELLGLQKVNKEKNNELNDLKLPLNNKNLIIYNNNEENDKIHTPNHTFNNENTDTGENSKILDGFRNENEELIKKIKEYQDKIKYYQKQIKNTKNELYEKIQANIEQQNNHLKQLKEMKNEYEKTIEEMDNKYKRIEKNLEECRNFNSGLNQEINDLNQKIISKEINILELKNQIKEIENQLANKKEENQKLMEELNNHKIVVDNKDDINGNIKEKLVMEEDNNINMDIEKKNEEIKNLKKENEKIKEKLIRLSKTLPEEYNELLNEHKKLEAKYKKLLNSINSSNCKKEEIHKTFELNEAKEEIEKLKKKNLELIKQLEEKNKDSKDFFSKNEFDNKTEQNVSNYEEEFDLRKMAKGAKEKNRSHDLNIDYPGIEKIKEKYRELEFLYNSIEDLVKKLLFNIQCNPKNKTFISELCKMVGFDFETTNKILTNKNKNIILGLFNK